MKRRIISVIGAGFGIALCVVMCYLSSMLLIGWERLSYLWFELPKVESELEKTYNISVVKIENLGPPDEMHIHITLKIKEKGNLTITAPTVEDIRNHMPIIVFGVENCILPRTEVFRMSLEEAIENFDDLYFQGQSNYCAPVPP